MREAAHAAAKAGFGNAPYTNVSANRDLITIVAIGRSESGGNASARHVNNSGSVDAGYWQINQVNWRGLQESAVKDLNVNATLAHEVYNRQGFAAWTDYRNNKYRSYLTQAESAVKSLGSESVQTGIEDVAGAEIITGTVDAAKTAVGILVDASKWVGDPHNWLRIVLVAGGVVLGLVSAAAIASETKAGRVAVKAASKGAL